MRRKLVCASVGVLVGITSLVDTLPRFGHSGNSSTHLVNYSGPTTSRLLRSAQERLLRGDISDQKLVQLSIEAKERLRYEPLDSTALILSGLGQGGRLKRSTLIFSDTITRRNRLGQLMLLDLKARSGDIRGSLVHLDRLLLTNPNLTGLMLRPVVANLPSDEILALFRPFVDRRWFNVLISSAQERSKDPQVAARLFLLPNEGHFVRPDAMSDNIIDRLLISGEVDLARAVASKQVGSNPKSLREFSPNLYNVQPGAGLLNWKTSQEIHASTWFELPILHTQVDPAFAGVVMRRVTSISAGAYRLTMKARVGSNSSLSWRLSCLQNGQFVELRSQKTMYDPDFRDFEMKVIVPPSCPLQEWSLYADNILSSVPTDMVVKELRLSPFSSR